MAAINLIWDGATDNVAIKGYEIDYKLTGSMSWTNLIFVSTSNGYGSTLFTEGELGDTYNFRIRTQDTSNNWSPYASSSVSIVDIVPPTAPTFLNLTPSPGIMLLEWGGAGDNTGIAGYEVYYKQTSNPTWVTSSFISTSATFADEEIIVDPNISYDFRVRTRDIGDNVSPYISGTATSIGAYEYDRSDDPAPGAASNKCPVIFSTTPVYSNKTVDNMQIGDVWYNDTDLSDPIFGDSLWYPIGNETVGFYSFRINDFGEIINKVTCFY